MPKRYSSCTVLGVHESEKLWTNSGHVSNMCQICVEMRTGILGGIDGLNTFWLLVLVQTCLKKVNLRSNKPGQRPVMTSRPADDVIIENFKML